MINVTNVINVYVICVLRLRTNSLEDCTRPGFCISTARMTGTMLPMVALRVARVGYSWDSTAKKPKSSLSKVCSYYLKQFPICGLCARNTKKNGLVLNDASCIFITKLPKLHIKDRGCKDKIFCILDETCTVETQRSKHWWNQKIPDFVHEFFECNAWQSNIFATMALVSLGRHKQRRTTKNVLMHWTLSTFYGTNLWIYYDQLSYLSLTHESYTLCAANSLWFPTWNSVGCVTYKILQVSPPAKRRNVVQWLENWYHYQCQQVTRKVLRKWSEMQYMQRVCANVVTSKIRMILGPKKIPCQVEQIPAVPTGLAVGTNPHGQRP